MQGTPHKTVRSDHRNTYIRAYKEYAMNVFTNWEYNFIFAGILLFLDMRNCVCDSNIVSELDYLITKIDDEEDRIQYMCKYCRASKVLTDMIVHDSVDKTDFMMLIDEICELRGLYAVACKCSLEDATKCAACQIEWMRQLKLPETLTEKMLIKICEESVLCRNLRL